MLLNNQQKSEKRMKKPLLLKEYETQLLLSNHNCFDEIESEKQNIFTKNQPKKSNEQILDEKHLNESISKITNEFLDRNEDLFIEKSEPVIHEQENVTTEIEMLKDGIIKTSDPNLSFVYDYILNKKYLFPKEQLTTQPESESESAEESDSQTKMTISYPRKIEKTSRHVSNSRTEKRKTRTENKLKKKKKILEKLKLEKGKKKKELIAKIKEIQGGSVEDEIINIPGLENPNGGLDTDDEVDDCTRESSKISKRRLKKLKRTEKFKKKMTSNEIDNNLDDELNNMDYEDIIDDTPVRYNYRTTTPNSFGLTAEEILLCDEKELNKWASMKKVIKITDEDEEKELIKTYKQRSKNAKIRRRILSSLYPKINAPKSSVETINTEGLHDTPLKDKKNAPQIMKPNRNRLVKRFFKKAQPAVIDNIPTERLLAYNLQNDTRFNTIRENKSSD